MTSPICRLEIVPLRPCGCASSKVPNGPPKVTPTALPPDSTSSTPPLLSVVPPPIVVPLAVPPDATISMPPPAIVVPLVVPPDETTCWPPLVTVVVIATPPEETTSRPPLTTVPPVNVPRSVSVTPLPTVLLPVSVQVAPASTVTCRKPRNCEPRPLSVPALPAEASSSRSLPPPPPWTVPETTAPGLSTTRLLSPVSRTALVPPLITPPLTTVAPPALP